jgi:Mn2+/Fe2+ NRAMP family transporter
VALLSSILLPYETYFYASGCIEDKWNASDIGLNRVIVVVGFVLGSTLSVALILLGADFFAPRHIEPQLPGTAALAPAALFGQMGVLLALLGMFFAFAGAAIETALAGAYNLAQFMGWPWGKFREPAVAARFTLAWAVIFVLATAIVISGIDPVSIVEYSIVFSVIILPFTYFPVLVIGSDRRIMGRHANGWLAKGLGWFYLFLIIAAAILAIPLLIMTHGGKG